MRRMVEGARGIGPLRLAELATSPHAGEEPRPARKPLAAAGGNRDIQHSPQPEPMRGGAT